MKIKAKPDNFDDSREIWSKEKNILKLQIIGTK